jgi:hypothetical protein
MESPSNDTASVHLARRVKEMENDVKELKKGASPSWQRWIEVFSRLLLPLLLFWLAFTFKDSVQHALEYQRLEVESAGAIEKLLQTLHQEEVDIGKATAAAITLSAYGEAATMPLVAALELGSTNTETAARQGLFFLGMSHPESVSHSLATVLSMQRMQFRWQTHQAAIEIAGKLSHPEARNALLSYRDLLEKHSNEGLVLWQQTVRGAKKENYEEAQKTLTDALNAFGLDWHPSNTGGGQ